MERHEEQPVESTIYSLSEQPPLSLERRGDERHLTLYRVGALLVNGRRELCLIKNISAGGMMIRAYCDLPPGTPVAVELKSCQMVSGQVSWAREANVGVAFDQPIDMVEVLSRSTDGPRPRMPRIETDCHAVIRDGKGTYRVRVHDISQGGVKVETATILPVGSDIVISLPGMAAQAGVVRWMDEGFAGLIFNSLLPLSTLIGWLQEQRSSLREAS